MHARRILLVAIVVLVAMTAATYAFLRRPETLLWATERLAQATAQSLLAENVSGSLLGVIHADRVRWRTQAGEVVFEDVDLVWSPLPILSGTVAFNQAHARSARLFLRPPEARQPGATSRLPVRLRFDQVAVGRFIVESKQPMQFLDVALGVRVGRDAVEMEILRVRGFGSRLEGQFRLGNDPPRPVRASLTVRPDGEETPRAPQLKIEADGSLARLHVDVQGTAGDSRMEARADLSPGAAQPVRALTASLTDFNPRDLGAGLPEARIRGELAAVDDGAQVLTGAMLAFNARAGPISDSRLPIASVRAVIGRDEEGWRVPALFFDLGRAGQLQGTGTAEGDGLVINLRTDNLDAAHLHADLAPTRLAGTVWARIDPRTRRAKVALLQKASRSVPASRYIADATLEPQELRVDELRIEAKGGSARGRGRIELASPRAFNASAEFRQFDPAVLGRYRAASLNGSFKARGVLDPALQTEGQAVVRPSTAFGLPATARATWRSRGAAAPTIALDLDARVGPTHIAAKGTLEDPANLAALNLALTIEGHSLYELTNVFGLPFPETTAPFHVQGRLAYDDKVWEFRDFKGSVGHSDLGGRFAIDLRNERTAMRGELVSDRLDVRDLWGLVGADPQFHLQDPGKVLPRGTFDPRTLRATDADVRFNGRRIVNETLPLRALEAHLVMRHGEVAVDPLVFRAAGGAVAGRVRLDARNTVIQGVADISARDVAVSRIAPSADADVASTGTIDGRALLHVRGNSVAAMLGSANGEVKLTMNGGSVSDVALRLANLDLANAMGAIAKGNRKIPIRCLVGDLAATDGTLRPRYLLLDTENTLLVGTGSIDLRDERLALRIVAEPKDPSLLSLRGPIRIDGTFADPEMRPELGSAIARAGAAIALGAVAGPLAIVPFLQIGERKEVDCKSLLADAAPFVAAGSR